MTVIHVLVVCTYDHVFHYTWSSLPLNEPSPEVALETTPVPEVVLVSEHVQFTQWHPTAWLVHVKIACIDNTLTRT